MPAVVNVSPTLNYRPVWLVGEIDFEVEMTHQHLIQTSTGVRGGAAKQFDYEWQWSKDEFIRRMEQQGNVYVGVPESLRKRPDYVDGFLVEGPFLPYNYFDPLPLAGDDNEPVARRRERTLDDTRGKVCYTMTAVFLVKEHVVRQVIEEEKSPAAFRALRNGKKVDGLWQPVAPAKKQHYVMGVPA